MKEYPRETVEYIPFGEVTADGEATVSFDYAITKTWQRPTVWTPNTINEGRPSFLVDGPALGRGTFTVWVRVDDSDETPVIEAGKFRLT